MKISIDVTHQPQPATGKLPGNIRYPILHGATVQCAESAHHLLIQQKKTISQALDMYIWDIKLLAKGGPNEDGLFPDLPCTVTVSQPMMCLVFILKGSATGKVFPFNALQLTPQYYHPMYAPSDKSFSVILQGHFHLMILTIGSSILDKLVARNPVFLPSKHNFTRKESYARPGHKAVMNQRVQKLLHKIRYPEARNFLSTEAYYQDIGYELLELYLADISRPKSPTRKEAEDVLCFLDQVDHILQNLEESLRIEDLVRQSKKSKSTIQRLFQTYTGHAPGHFITQEKMKKGAHRLVTESCTVLEIALSCGYSYNAFLEAFKLTYKCTPDVYRILKGASN